jgi:hypothetical protein
MVIPGIVGEIEKVFLYPRIAVNVSDIVTEPAEAFTVTVSE